MSLIPFRIRTSAPAWRQADSSLNTFSREMNDLLNTFFSDDDRETGVARQGSWTSFTPHLDVVEKDKVYEVNIELPGIDEKDVDLSLENNLLTIKGEKKSKHEETNEGFRRIERSYGSFQRSIPFAVELDETKVEATFKNGVLHVTLPKAPSAIREAKKIQIKNL